jgi:hypothetical protein
LGNFGPFDRLLDQGEQTSLIGISSILSSFQAPSLGSALDRAQTWRGQVVERCCASFSGIHARFQLI